MPGRGDLVRLLAVWCPDWPVTAASIAAGVPSDRPAAVLSANRVVACSAIARRNGVRRGMRRRDAQSCCPELAVLGVDPARDARLFEPAAAAVEDLVVGVEVVRPGIVAAPVAGALGYFKGEHELIERLVDHVAGKAGIECQVGMAEGLFAAVLAARRSVVVAIGGSTEFLAPLPITELEQADEDRGELVDLLRRLGLRTLGQFAELSERVVASRFGREGTLAHRLAMGRSERPLARRRPQQELVVEQAFDPPLGRVDAAAFVAKALAEKLHAELTARDLACTRLGIYALTEAGEELTRVWRCAGWDGGSNAVPVSAQGIADRVRWQFEGWLRGDADIRPSGGVVRLRLEPAEVVDSSVLQLGLWRGQGKHRGDDVADERAGRALVRVQGLLGPEGAGTAVLGGGRGPADRVRFVPWGDPRTALNNPPTRLPATAPHGRASRDSVDRAPPPPRFPLAVLSEGPSTTRYEDLPSPGERKSGSPDPSGGVIQDRPSDGGDERPWPGRLPAPSPTTVPVRQVRATVVDEQGAQVALTGRSVLTGAPHRVAVEDAEPRPVRGWAGPWPVDERWWEPASVGMRARVQVVVDPGDALLLLYRANLSPRWIVEGEYD